MVVLTPAGSVFGDSNEEFGTMIDAAWSVEPTARLTAKAARFLLSEAIEDFIVCPGLGILFVTTLRVRTAAPCAKQDWLHGR